MISSATRAKLLVMAVFVVGLVVGAVVDNVYETRWRADRESRRTPREVNQVYYDQLELTPEQRQQFQSIVEASRPDFDKLFAENRKLLEPNNRKIAELQEQTRTKIRAILTEEQAKKYNEINEKRRQTRRPPMPRQ